MLMLRVYDTNNSSDVSEEAPELLYSASVQIFAETVQTHSVIFLANSAAAFRSDSSGFPL